MLAISCTKENPRWEITRTGTIAYRAKLEYGYTSKSSYLLLFFPIKQGIIREFNGLYFSFQSLFIYTNGAIPL